MNKANPFPNLMRALPWPVSVPSGRGIHAINRIPERTCVKNKLTRKYREQKSSYSERSRICPP